MASDLEQKKQNCRYCVTVIRISLALRRNRIETEI